MTLSTKIEVFTDFTFVSSGPSGQIGMAATCGNGYVFDKLLKREGAFIHALLSRVPFALAGLSCSF